MSLGKYNFLLAIIFLMDVAFSESTDTLMIENFEKLKLKLGLDRQSEFDEDAFNLLVDKLDSLNIKDEQLIDGYEWGGGQAGFKSYLNKNIDVLLDYFNSEISEIDSLNKQIIPDSLRINEQILVKQDSIKPVQDLLVKVSSTKVEEPVQKNESKKGLLSGLRIGSGLGKALIKGTSLSNYSSYVESAFSIRTPIGINIGPFLTRVGYESAGYSFDMIMWCSLWLSYFLFCSASFIPAARPINPPKIAPVFAPSSPSSAEPIPPPIPAPQSKPPAGPSHKLLEVAYGM